MPISNSERQILLINSELGYIILLINSERHQTRLSISVIIIISFMLKPIEKTVKIIIPVVIICTFFSLCVFFSFSFSFLNVITSIISMKRLTLLLPSSSACEVVQDIHGGWRECR